MAGPTRRRRRLPVRELGLLVVSLAVVLALVEVALRRFLPAEVRRALQEVAAAPNGLVDGHFAGLYARDAGLGWVPRAGASGSKWGVPVTILADGTRSNGSARVHPVAVLAIGDSYTFGDEARDADTWPARLEAQIGRGVLNGGVSSYGLDQMVLRAEDLLPTYHPRVLVVVLIDDSVARTHMAVRHGLPKPYFVADGGTLLLRNVPAPAPVPVPFWRRFLLRSFTIDYVMDRLSPGSWWRGTMRDMADAPNDEGAVSAALVERLVARAERERVRLVFVLLDIRPGDENDPEMGELRRFIGPHLGTSVALVDTAAAFARAAGNHAEGVAAFENPSPLSHLNAAGNQIVADAIREEVEAALAGGGR